MSSIIYYVLRARGKGATEMAEIRGNSPDGWAIWGASARGTGVVGTSNTGVGVYGEADPGARAGLFEGSVLVRGNFDVVSGSKNFKIDHPLDPKTRYLSHTCVESSEMKNVYDGVAQLDEDGAASVDLPEWCEALNGDFRYQLTAVGGAAPNLHVAEEISENRFKIAGGQEGMKVCWQVTGSRKDPWAAANPFEVEQEKPQEERGRYLQPNLYDAPEELRVRIGSMEAPVLAEVPAAGPALSSAMPSLGAGAPGKPTAFAAPGFQFQSPAMPPGSAAPGFGLPEEENRRQIDELKRQIEELRQQR
jgi:hypothetical protein